MSRSLYQVALAILVIVMTGGSLAHGAQPAPAPGKVQQIVIVFKTHFDIGYTDLAANVVQRYRTTMIDQALDVVDQNRDLPPAQQFVWTIPGWPMHQILDWPDQTPQRKQRVQQAIKEGRFVVHALPFTTHTELLEAEDLVRGLGHSSRVMRSLGMELPRDAKMTDVPEHTWMLPTLLKHAGVDFMHIGCNGMSYSPKVPPLFWWEGPDGSRLLTMYSPNYGTGLLPPADWPYGTWLALQHTGDNHGPPRPEEVKKVLAELAAKMPGVKVRIGRLSDFADAILAEKPDLPVVHGDTPDSWIHGPMCDPAGAKIARNVRPLIAATEALNTQTRAWGLPVEDAEPAIMAAYEQSLLYGEHTWGGSIGWIGNKLSFGEQFTADRAAGRFKRSEASWDEHTAYIEKARDLVMPALTSNLQALARGVAVEGARVIVYNPLPWPRDGMVTVGTESAASIAVLKEMESGSVLPVASSGGVLQFAARNVPPMGYRTYVPVKAELPPSLLTTDLSASTIESPFFKVVMDPARGRVKSLVDKTTGRELVDNSAQYGLGQYLYERFDSKQVLQYCKDYIKAGRLHPDFYKPGQPSAEEVPYSAVSPIYPGITLASEPGIVTAIMQESGFANTRTITLRIRLYERLPYLDMEITLYDKRLEPWPEAGWLCLPLKLDQPRFRLGRLGSIIDPAKDVIPGSNRTIFALNSGMSISDPQGYTVGLCPLDTPLVSLDQPGCWKFSLDFVPTRPVVFVNLFNNQWNTNFRLWNGGGSWTSRVRLWTTTSADADTALITPSLESRYPLQAATAEGPGGKLPATQSGLALSRQGVLVTAFGPNPDGPGTLLRLWEYAGKSGACQVRLPAGMKAQTMELVDLRGRPIGKPVSIEPGTFTLDLRAFAPVSVLIP